MTKMNFEYKPHRPQAETEIRLPLLGLGYVILAASLAWMAAPLLMHG